MLVNKNLLWDYDWKEEQYETEEFKQWYIARVLSRGSTEDVQGVGIGLIKEYLPKIAIPKRIREYWEFVFTLPIIKHQYGEYHDAT
ncbi:MAG: hypothetical protein HYZ34_11220 [Ignavibacteriae bacterium]|nr:hypothetical protein [Ignavibacteriota bacterium]